MGGRVLDLSGSEQEQIANCNESGDKPCGSIKWRKILE